MSLALALPFAMKSGRALASGLVKNSNALLAALGLISLGGTVTSLVRAVPKVKEELRKRDEDLEIAKDEETAQKIKRAAFKKVALILAVPVLMIVLCGGSIIGNAWLNNRKMAELAALYALSEQKIEDLEKAAQEIAGGKKAGLIEEYAGQKDVERRAPKNEEAVINTGRGNDLFWEPKTGHWIRANRDFIKLAFSEMNGFVNDMNSDEDDMTLNRLLDNMKLPADTLLGNLFGWQPGDVVGCSLTTTGKHFWDDGSDEYYTVIDYTVRYLGPEGKLA